jgi:hypothetical protein
LAAELFVAGAAKDGCKEEEEEEESEELQGEKSKEFGEREKEDFLMNFGLSERAKKTNE